ncbi:helix-turn-helix transcriptional regulator [Nakamurella aerolata]|uniref:WYL domain-containing protein n=1 Tax=Nakamurella aerolata TaxID=1656892 RepID=A0A849AKS4_9ACTN|nr:WYL domain-containing protein [Nakamurella aerolata]NNG37422.1 WYL domain-containing protein [Nakamurella aerolata]
MADVTERMLALLSALQTGRAFAGDELADRLGVSGRTLRRDVQRLRGYGYLVDTQPGPGGHYRLVAGRSMPPLVLDDDEAVATLLGLASLASTAPLADGAEGLRGNGSEPAPGRVDAAATRAYGKLDQLLPTRLRQQVAAIRASLETSRAAAPAVSAATLSTLAQAIAAGEIVTFEYRSGRAGPGAASSHRRVEPHRQVHHLLRWYLVGWDVGRGDWRLFRLDRMTDLLRTGAPAAARELPAESALEYLRSGINRRKRPVSVDVAAAADTVADVVRYHDAELVPLGRDRTRVVLQVDSWPWLALLLAQLQSQAGTVTLDWAPAELRGSLISFGRQLAALAEF